MADGKYEVIKVGDNPEKFRLNWLNSELQGIPIHTGSALLEADMRKEIKAKFNHSDSDIDTLIERARENFMHLSGIRV